MVWARAHSLGEAESNWFVQPGEKAEGRLRCHLQCSDRELQGEHRKSWEAAGTGTT